MKKMKYLSISAMTAFVLMSCSESSLFNGNMTQKGKELRLQAEIDQVNITRANDAGFADGDRIGVFAVDFANGQPGKLLAKGNNADNVDFKFNTKDNSWSGKSIFFKDDNTPMDVYGYYPYTTDIADVEKFPFAVKNDQTADAPNGNMSGYEASDLLWAKAAAVTPSAPIVNLTFKHILSSVQVSLVNGGGFTADEWASFDKSVLVSGTRCNATVNLSTGVVTPVGDAGTKPIVACLNRNDFRAVVIPQTIDAGTVLLSITVGGHTLKFTKKEAMTYFPSKMHKFTVEVNPKRSGDFEFKLVNEAITAWESDLISHNGTAKEYLVVNVPEAGQLESAVKEMKLDPAEIINLKLTGALDNTDFEYIRNNMSSLEAVNLHDVDLSKPYGPNVIDDFEYMVPELAFSGLFSLKYVVFPKKIKKIGQYAFKGTGLAGSLEIPEGVLEIGEEAFSNLSTGAVNTYAKNNLTGTLTLPSTLKRIEDRAFAGCKFSGSLLLPDGLELIDVGAFNGCDCFTGDLNIPGKCKINSAFNDMKNITGRLTLHSDIKTISGFCNMGITGIGWPDNLVEIGNRTFLGLKKIDEIRIPESVTAIGDDCFLLSEIRHLTLPSEITKISSGCFAWSYELSDTITIPDKVEYIGEDAFRGCKKIEALVLPAKLRTIAKGAFSECFGINYIHCNAVEPPQLDKGAFNGVEKDNFTLEVPEQSVDAYRKASGWSEFRRISAYRNFVARPSKCNMLNKGGRKEIILNADADWEMTDCPNWCHIDKTSGSKKTTLTLIMDKMAHGQPNRFGKISFRLKDDEGHITHIDVGQYDYQYEEDEYLTLQSARKGKGINLVFLGDGYDAADISSGCYLMDMKQEMEYFFGVEPYTTYRDYFNVYTAFALSDDSGVESVNVWRRTKFHVSTGDGCPLAGQRVSADYIGALDYCATNVPPTLAGNNPQVGCVLVANTNIYEGLTYMGNSFCAVVTKSTEKYPNDARGLVQHEAGGHGFGWLGDEYIYHPEHIFYCECPCCKHVPELMGDHAAGFSLNLSLEGQHKKVPWSHLIFKPGYGDIVDIYEGGYFHGLGIYRSEANSCMNNNIPYHSSWSRQLIVQRIMKLAGEKFDLESFYAKDSREMGRDFTGTTRSKAANMSSGVRRGNPPVRIKNYKYGKKGGRR